MYLSKPILFIIIVVVLFIGGTSGLIQHVENSSSSSKHYNSRGLNRKYNNRDNDKSSSSGSDKSDSSDIDSDNDERRFSHVLNHKIRDTQTVYTTPGTGPRPGLRELGLGAIGLGAKASVEGFTASNNVKCMPGCKIATSISGNCKWIPESEPKHKQRLICPHVCDTDSNVDGPKCESNIDCSDCTPQPDFTVTSYTTTQIKNTAANTSCVKGTACNIINPKALTICNPSVWPNNPAQNLVCTKTPGSSSEFVWTEADSAAKQIPLHADQAKVLACDAKQGCAVDGDSCMNANFDKIYCNDNIWVTDPKYDKSTYSTDKKGTGTSGSSGSSGSAGSSGSGSGSGTSELRDNYYITNYFFGPSKDAESSGTYKLGLGLGLTSNIKDNNDKKRRSRRDDNNDDDTEKKPGIIDKIKESLKKEKKVEATVGLGLYGNNYGIGGNATVPPILPKGEVAVVQAYESSIKL